MSVVAIKGMKMPKNCNECPFKTNDYVCGLLDCAFSCNHFKELNYNCPLVEIVTCKDCIHRDEYGCRHGHPNCKENFYCCDAIRKE